MRTGRGLGLVARLIAVAVFAAVAVGSAPAGAAAAARVSPERFTPLPPAAEVSVSPEARALRDRLLGPRWSDPRYVTLHWVGVSSFIVTMGGHVFLFDAWEIVGVHKDYLPIGREELAGIAPEAILIGHGHFDHGADVGYVAGRNASAILASEEQCTTAEADAARDGNAGRFTCVQTGTQTTPEFGAAIPVKLFADLDPVTVLKGVHSATRPPGNGNEPDPFTPVTNFEPYLSNPNFDPGELALFLDSASDPEGGTRMYHFRVGGFTLLLGDSAGPIFEYPTIRASLDSLPGCVDVMANAILGFDQPVSGLQDPVLYVKHAHPRVFLPNHGDAWAPAVSAGQAAYKEQLETELRALDNPPEVDYLLDPQDYMRERAYLVGDPKWRAPMPGSSCARGTNVGPGAPAGRERRRERLRLAVRPRRARLGRVTRFRFRVSAVAPGGRRRPVPRALVRLGRRFARTDSRGRATIVYRLTHRDVRRRPSARARSLGRASTRIRVTLPRRR